jgi:PTS system fructose-specific IIA component/PTS system nitrogen regulatory IIA component
MIAKDMFSRECVNFKLRAETKSEALNELIHMLAECGKITDELVFKEAVLKREEELSTGIGMGIAIPHGRSSVVKEVSIAFGKREEGVDYGSVDGEPVKLFFLIAVPAECEDIHLRALSKISGWLIVDDISEKLMSAGSFEEFIKIFE